MLLRPTPDRAVGDVIPFFDSRTGRYHAFYLSTLPGASPEDRLHGVTWEHVSSSDLIEWVQHPTAIAPAPQADAYDRDGIYTGSIIEDHGCYYAFYTGVNADSATPQTICRATSDDLIHWEKDPGNPILVPDGAHFESLDWRDPLVLRDEESGGHTMLITSRSLTGPAGKRGCIAVATSTDLTRWEIASEPAPLPLEVYTAECCDVHRIGDEYLLTYSSFTGDSGIHALVSNSPRGPWRDAIDFADSARYYAPKSLQAADRRVLSFGWIPDRAEDDETKTFVWGGDFAVVRETWIDERGRVCQRPAREELSTYVAMPTVALEPVHGDWLIEGATASVRTPSAWAFAEVELPSEAESVLLSTRIDWAESDAGVAGVAIGANTDATTGVQLSIDRLRATVRLHQLSDAHTHMVVNPDGDWVSHNYSLDGASTTDVLVFLRGTCIEIFVDDRLALSHRILGLKRNKSLKLVASNSCATFRDVAVSVAD